MELRQIGIDEIEEPSQVIRSWISQEDLEDLARSIQERGVLLPIRVVKRGDKYEIEDGHRRYLAARMAGLTRVPCVVVEDEGADLELNKLVANLHREEMSPLDTARALFTLKVEYGYSIDDLAKMIGKSGTRVRQLLSLLDLPPDIQEALEDKVIPESVARILGQVQNPERRQYYLRYAVEGGATTAMVKAWVAREKVFEMSDAEPPAPEAVVEEVAEQHHQRAVFKCKWCLDERDLNEMLQVSLCPECYRVALDTFERTRNELAIVRLTERSQQGGHHEE